MSSAFSITNQNKVDYSFSPFPYVHNFLRVEGLGLFNITTSLYTVRFLAADRQHKWDLR